MHHIVQSGLNLKKIGIHMPRQLWQRGRLETTAPPLVEPDVQISRIRLS